MCKNCHACQISGCTEKTLSEVGRKQWDVHKQNLVLSFVLGFTSVYGVKTVIYVRVSEVGRKQWDVHKQNLVLGFILVLIPFAHWTTYVLRPSSFKYT